MKEGLSTNYNDITREDVVVTYTPSSQVVNYSYVITKNDINTDSRVVDSNTPSTIILNETGDYIITITEFDEFGNTNIIKSEKYRIDKEAPIINVKEKIYKIINLIIWME